MMLSNAENIDPNGGAKPVSKIPIKVSRRTLEEKTNGAELMMPPPANVPLPQTSKGRSLASLSKTSDTATSGHSLRLSSSSSSLSLRDTTSIPVAPKFNSVRSKSLSRKSPDINNTNFGGDLEDRLLKKMEKLVGQNNEEKIQNLRNEIMRIKNENNEWSLEKQKLQDKITELQEKLQSIKDEHRNQQNEITKEHMAKISQFQDTVNYLKQENFTISGNFKIELANKTLELKQQMLDELEKERGLLRTKFENDQIQDKQVHRQEIQDVKTQLDRNYQQQLTIVCDSLENEKNHYKAEIEHLKQAINQIEQNHQQAIQQLQHTFSQEKRKLTVEYENATKQVKAALTEVDNYKERYLAEKHETQVLRTTLSELSASSMSIESVSKSQQSQIEEMQYQLELQKQKSLEMRLEMQRAQEERDIAKDKLLKEEIIRRKLHNQIQELKGNIRVFCRVRPKLLCEENSIAEFLYPDQQEEGQQLTLSTGSDSLADSKKLHTFNFDKVFRPNCDNFEIFQEISQLVQSSLDGYNVCIFAYGQTGSGKTFTMSSNDGMIPRAINQIFESAEALKEKGWSYEFEGHFLEIYNETLYDLLTTNSNNNNNDKLEIKHDTKEMKTTVTNITTVKLTSPSAGQLNT